MINEVSPSSPGVNGIGSMSSVWAVVEAARAGASDARDAAANALPQTARLIRSGIHTTGFAIGFTVCFPAFLVARLMPKDNCLAYGLADGSRAACDLARETVRPTVESDGGPELALVRA
jgi:hypothetical protein